MNPTWIVPKRSLQPAAAVLAVVLAAASAVLLFVQRGDAQGLPDGSAFELRGQEVTVDELDQRINTLVALYEIAKPTGGAKLDTFRRDAAKSMAVSMILAGEAERAGIDISRSDARAGLSRVIDDNLAGDRAKFVEFLGNAGISENDVLDEVTRTLATSRLYTKITEGVAAPTAAEAKADYEAHKAEMVSAEQRTLSNLVVATEEEAEVVLGRLRAGEAFAEVAREVTLDASTRDAGGALGTHIADELDPAYAEVAFAAKKGALFGPQETSGGFNVGRVDDVVPPRQLSFAEVKDTLIAALQSREQLEVWNAWLAKVIKAAKVEYAAGYRPADPDAVPSTANPEEPQP